MLRILKQCLKTGIITDPKPATNPDTIEQVGIKVKKMVGRHFYGSLAIRQLDAGSCNACELEIHALNNAYYDISRFGIHFVASPRHADVLLVTGVVSRHMQSALLRTYAAMAEPRYVIAAGECACNGGEFGVNYASCGSLDNIMEVDAWIPGCPPTPVQLMQGILALQGK